MFNGKLKMFNKGLSKIIHHWKILIINKNKNEKVLVLKLKIKQIWQTSADLDDPETEIESWINNTLEFQKKLLT